MVGGRLLGTVLISTVLGREGPEQHSPWLPRRVGGREHRLPTAQCNAAHVGSPLRSSTRSCPPSGGSRYG